MSFIRLFLVTAAILAPATGAWAQDHARELIESKLSNVKVTLDFKDAPLDTIVDYLREIADINIFVDSKVREKNLIISLKVSEITLKSVLSLMLKPHQCDTMFREGVLMVMTREDVVDRTIKMQIYDCRDILYPVRDFPGIDIDLNPNQIGILNQAPEDASGSEMPIEEMVRAHTGGRTWEENPKCVCKMNNGLLVVKNTPEVHKQIVRLLDLLRRNK